MAPSFLPPTGQCAAIFLLITALSTAVQAQEAAQPPNNDVSQLQQYVVEGSPVTQAPLDPASVDLPRTSDDALPYVGWSAAQIDELGLPDTTALLSDINQNSSYRNSNIRASQANKATGITGFNLFGLGDNNTLVLIDGQRVLSPVTGTGQPNLSLIPIDDIANIELLPSTSSALYGANASGGVLNVTLRHNVVGSEIDATYGNSFNVDGSVRDISLLSGVESKDGRTNLTVALNLTDETPFTLGDLGFESALRERILATDPSLIYGSVPPLSVPGNVESASGAPLGIPGNPTATFAGIPAGYNGTGGIAAFRSTAGVYNLGTAGWLSSGASGGSVGDNFDATSGFRNSALSLDLRHTFNPRLTGFVSLWYAHEDVYGAYQPAVQNGITVPANNPYNPFGQAVIVNFIPADLDPNPTFEGITDDYRIVAGADGKLGARWTWSTDYTFEFDDLPYRISASSVNLAPLTTAIDQTNPALAYDPFLDFSAGYSNSPSVIASAATTADWDYRQYFSSGDLRLHGTPLDLPAGPLVVAAGLEYRGDSTWQDFNNTYLAATNALLTSTDLGSIARQVKSAYAETQIPLLGGKETLPGAQALDLDLAVRHEDYSDFGGTTDPEIAVGYRPIKDLLIRASWGEGFVAPTLSQLLPPSGPPTSATVLDPLRGNQAESVLTTTNPSLLGPERTGSWGLGVVLEPGGLPGLRLSADGFDVHKTGDIESLTAQQVVDNASLFPGQVVRGPVPAGSPYAVGPITQVFTGSSNAYRSSVEGVDFAVDYGLPTNWGKFDLRGNAAFVNTYDVELSVGGPLINYVNDPLDETDAPVKWRGNLGLYWQKSGWGAGVTCDFIGSYLAMQGMQAIQGGNYVSSDTTFDVQASYAFPEKKNRAQYTLEKGLGIEVGVDNVLDRRPPFVADGNYWGYSLFSSPREAYGYVSLKKKFL